MTYDDALEESLDQLSDDVMTDDKAVALNEVKQQSPISPFDVTHGLATLPKVSALLRV